MNCNHIKLVKVANIEIERNGSTTYICEQCKELFSVIDFQRRVPKVKHD